MRSSTSSDPRCCGSRAVHAEPGGRRGGRAGDVARRANGIDRFEGRSSLKTWIFRILVNRAKTRGTRERRTVPFAALAAAEADGDFPRSSPSGSTPLTVRRPGGWAAPLPRWETLPRGAAESRETLAAAHAAIDELPEMQRTVILLRDVEGWDGPQVSNALGHQRDQSASAPAPRQVEGPGSARATFRSVMRHENSKRKQTNPKGGGGTFPAATSWKS